MTDSNSDKYVQRLFAKFVQLRQNDQPPEAAWANIQREARALSDEARHQLAALVQAWESRYGMRYRSSDDDVHTTTTMSQRPIKIKKLRSQRPPDETTQPLTVDDRLGEAYFPHGATLVMEVRGAPPLLISIPAHGEIVIGRSAPDSILIPDVDLGRVRGHKLGVSRVHASIKRDGNTLVITDMDSKNYTFINGKRLLPNEVRVLRHGDEVRFANLIALIKFEIDAN